ncbi:hypothetical protein BCV69DRAFT_281843 [Microstroma glucosiphilum]|uniref:Uncharacterized protein n=1 Tax=Pseudomicrostroma glucosiphilum TaxID=1684307 RepID=A0A316UAR0_9BASI|nr:hypothetical protein BCV69DRAFT_281843 [Pseudomicrostroma glucosiphilum]PWN21938.1 hypothetical protein BCV69DRAFT_281843 [Pseudomicrostroma glucosiphilum]
MEPARFLGAVGIELRPCLALLLEEISEARLAEFSSMLWIVSEWPPFEQGLRLVSSTHQEVVVDLLLPPER